MKKNKFLFLPVILGCLIISGCKKDSAATSTTPLTKIQILVKYSWQPDEVLRNSSCKNSHYVKDDINTTGINYSAVRIIFKEDGTGTYTTDLGQTFPATWKFTSTDQKNMEFSVSYPGIVTYTWNFVEISDNSFSKEKK